MADDNPQREGDGRAPAAPAIRLSGVRGMNDILPADEALWRAFEEAVADTMRACGYRQIRTPIVEHTRLFVRSIGEVTDIVEKEMYSFTDVLNGEDLTLRPENTAGVVRAVIEHNLLYDGPKRLWYAGPMFRHERPQKGRYRQFHQVGAEALGFAGPDADAEVILLCQRLWDQLGLAGISLEINSLGSAPERRAHREALIAHFESRRDELDADAQRRLNSNPLRILDTKNPEMAAIVDSAPQLVDFLGDASRAHFERLQALLKAQNVPFRINPRLVRGLDYYNLTVFEWVARVGNTPLTVCGGGRYDPLIEMLGGKPAPACGCAIGVERVLELMRGQGGAPAQAQCDVYVVHHGDVTLEAAMQVAERVRDAGFDVILHCGGGSFKSQFRRADA
ncbi:MAG: histidine--tRNA ligase, partial [Gammaproteobacteria bacterium]